MQKWLHRFYKLSWKKIAGMGVLVLGLALLPTIKEAATNPTRTRSEAALLPKPQPITKEFQVPEGPPEIYLVDHFFGKAGDAVLIHGKNLGGLHENSSVSLSGEKISEENLVSWTGDYIEFKVPEGAESGRVEVNILGETTSWQGLFFVTDEATETELRLKGEAGQGWLQGMNLGGGSELLVWLLIVSGEGELNLQPASGVTMESRSFSLPIGKIYEASLKLNKSLSEQSINLPVNLMAVSKNADQVVGIARGELSTAKGEVLVLKANPLYVSF